MSIHSIPVPALTVEFSKRNGICGKMRCELSANRIFVWENRKYSRDRFVDRNLCNLSKRNTIIEITIRVSAPAVRSHCLVRSGSGSFGLLNIERSFSIFRLPSFPIYQRRHAKLIGRDQCFGTLASLAKRTDDDVTNKWRSSALKR